MGREILLDVFCYTIWDLWDSKVSTSPNKIWNLWDSKRVQAQNKNIGPLRLKKYMSKNFEDWSKQDEVWRISRQAGNDRHILSSLRGSVRILGNQLTLLGSLDPCLNYRIWSISWLCASSLGKIMSLLWLIVFPIPSPSSHRDCSFVSLYIVASLIWIK